MITLTKSGNAIVFTFDGNDHYLNDGTIEVPVNSLTLVTDESQMATFKKSATNDIFISATYNELGMSKADLESWFKENACGSTGGGGGVTPEEVQTMIDESVSGKADISDVATVSGDVSLLSEQVETDEKVTATALNALNNGLSGATASINNVSSTLNNHTGNSEIHISSADRENWNDKVGFEDVTYEVQKDSTELVEGGAIFDKVAYTTSGSAVVTGETTNKRIGTVRRGSWTNSVGSLQDWCWNEELPEGSCDLDGGELRMSFTRDISELDITIGDYNNSFTVRYDANEDNLEADNATVEWADATKREIIITDYPTIFLEEVDTSLTDGATVTPVEESTTYVGLKYIYSSEQTIETTHWVVDEIKNKVDKTEFETRIGEDEEVTSAALNELNDALSGKQDTLIAGTNITISGNVISAQGGGGGGKAIEAGRGIEVTTGETADTVSFNLPISATTAGTGSIQMLNTNTTNSDARSSLIVGQNNSVTAGWSYVFGSRNSVGNNCVSSFILGSGNNHNGNIGDVRIIGNNNKTYSLGGGEIIIGYNNNISGGANTSGNRIFIGEGLSAKNPKEIATGKYNVSHSGSTDADKSLFSVGNGTSSAATHNAFEIRQNGDIYITSGGTDIKLQDNLGGGGGGLPESAFTAYTASTEARISEDEEVTAAALNVLNTALGGFKLQGITQAAYDALVSGGTVDANTLYIITNVVN